MSSVERMGGFAKTNKFMSFSLLTKGFYRDKKSNSPIIFIINTIKHNPLDSC
jgi:hypothetical protein